MQTDKVVEYYEGATPDYEAWSRNFNMHFGYWTWPLPPWGLERMLEQMNEEVIQRLALNGLREGQILDLGCGVGGTLRHGARARPDLTWVGVSLVEQQLERAAGLNVGLPIRLVCADYTACPFESNRFDGVYALESSCHAEGPGKASVISEMYRLLKPGQRLVVGDGMLTRPACELSRPFLAVHDLLCQNWAVPGFAELPKYLDNLKKVGFQDIVVEDIGLRIGPSVLHSPWLVLTFVLGKIWRSRPLSAVTRRHLLACLLAPVMGMHPAFSYYLITCRKP